jgi:hypothetical protein
MCTHKINNCICYSQVFDGLPVYSTDLPVIWIIQGQHTHVFSHILRMYIYPGTLQIILAGSAIYHQACTKYYTEVGIFCKT